MKKLNYYLFLASLVVFYQCNDKDINDIANSRKTENAQQISVKQGILIFENRDIFEETVNELNAMSSEELQIWGNNFGFTSMKQSFNKVLAAEWAISDYYENLSEREAEQIGGVPTEPVYSKEYQEALLSGLIRVVEDPEGDYFDYNIYETQLACVLNEKGLVIIHDTIFHYTLEAKKWMSIDNFNQIDKLQKASIGFKYKGIEVIPYKKGNLINAATNDIVGSWHYDGKDVNGNPGWSYSPNNYRRYRTFLEGSFTITEDGQKLYVTNLLWLQGQKKNFWGNWKFGLEGYYCTVNGSWYYEATRIYYSPAPALPVQSYTPPIYTSPFNWSSGNVGNASLQIHPHINGNYINTGDYFTHLFSNFTLYNIDFTVTINNVVFTIED